MSLRALTAPLCAAIIVLCAWYSEVVVKPHPAPGPVHITYWEKWTGFEGDAIRATVDYYNKSQNRIHVDLLTVSNIENKTLLAIAGGDPPDLAGLYGPNVTQYADDHAVMALDDYCKRCGITADRYIPSYWNIGLVHGHVYALPTTPASTALHYDLTLFSDSGLSPSAPPKTIEELDADAQRITLKGPNGKIARSGFIPAEPGWWNWGWGYVFGGRLWDGGTRITANSPENVRAFAWIQSFSQKYGVGALQTFRSGFGNFSSPQNAFLSGKVAMELQGVWMSNFIHMFNPELKWAAVPFPYPADRPDLKDGTFIDEDVLVIPRGAKHPNEAFDFIRFIESQKGMEMLCALQRKHTPLIEVSAGYTQRTGNPFIKLFHDLPMGKNTYFPPKLGIWPEYSQELNDAFDRVTLMQATPQEALDAVKAHMQPKLDEYLERLRARGEQQ